MDDAASPIPNRAETLELLRLLGRNVPLLMLKGDDDGYGTRWTMLGQQVQPAIASYLMNAGFVAATSTTEFGARRLTLTATGSEFLQKGDAWWSGLSLPQRLWVRLFG